MKRTIILLAMLVTLGGFGYWMYLLDSRVLQEFVGIYAAFNMNIPAFSVFIISSVYYWKFVVGAVAAFSFLALLAGGKIQYVSIVLPIFMSILYFCGLYVPVIFHGTII